MHSREEIEKEQRAWRKISYGHKFQNAFRGLQVFYFTTKNLKTHLTISLIVILSGFYFKILNLEWIALVFSIGLVFITEALNTAIEIDIDLTSPEYHPYARDTKDVAASAVLLSIFVAIIVGFVIFLPHLL